MVLLQTQTILSVRLCPGVVVSHGKYRFQEVRALSKMGQGFEPWKGY